MDKKFTIVILDNGIEKDSAFSNNRFLAFKTTELRDEFFDNFKELIEQAKPLL